MGLYHNRLQAPTKTLAADWIPEEGELFRDSAGNLYCGDNVTASNALTPVSNGAQGKRIWRASVVQDSGPLVATVMENSLGGTVVWAWDGVNTNSGTLTGAFAGLVQVFMFEQIMGSYTVLQWVKISDNQIDLVFDGGTVIPIDVMIIVG
jgi:hypothetical protein